MENSEFMNYIIQPLTFEQMNLLYKANDIKFDKCELYYDFIKSLNKLLSDTYLGAEYINSDKETKEHYLWCFNKVIKNFKEARIIIGKPTVIIAKTTKGKGVSYMENRVEWHYKSPSENELKAAISELENA